MTFAIENLVFYDTETRGGSPAPYDDVTTVGGPAYFAAGAKVTLLPYAIGDGPVRLIENWDGIEYRELPLELRQAVNAANIQRKQFVAFNAAFDRYAWRYGIAKSVPLTVRAVIDAMAQVVASNLPPSLEGVSQALNLGGKHPDGKRLIKLFCGYEPLGTPQSHPDDWDLFRQYAIEDVEQLRLVFTHTRQLPLQEWEEYWASEAINDRGMPIDIEFAKRAAAVASANVARSNAKLKKMTDGVISKVTQRERIANWVWDHMVGHPEVLDIMTKQVREDPDSEDDLIVTKVGIDRRRIEQILAYLDTVDEKQGLTDEEWLVYQMLEIRQWDGSSAPAKFEKALMARVGDRMKNCYVFNGAAQTGRFSSRVWQAHNMPNKYIGMEEKDPTLEELAIEMINEIEVPT